MTIDSTSSLERLPLKDAYGHLRFISQTHSALYDQPGINIGHFRAPHRIGTIRSSTSNSNVHVVLLESHSLADTHALPAELTLEQLCISLNTRRRIALTRQLGSVVLTDLDTSRPEYILPYQNLASGQTTGPNEYDSRGTIEDILAADADMGSLLLRAVDFNHPKRYVTDFASAAEAEAGHMNANLLYHEAGRYAQGEIERGISFQDNAGDHRITWYKPPDGMTVLARCLTVPATFANSRNITKRVKPPYVLIPRRLDDPRTETYVLVFPEPEHTTVLRICAGGNVVLGERLPPKIPVDADAFLTTQPHNYLARLSGRCHPFTDTELLPYLNVMSGVKPLN